MVSNSLLGLALLWSGLTWHGPWYLAWLGFAIVSLAWLCYHQLSLALLWSAVVLLLSVWLCLLW